MSTVSLLNPQIVISTITLCFPFSYLARL